MPEGFTKILASKKVPEGGIAVGRCGVTKVAVTRRGGKLYAFRDLCPHAGYPLSKGKVCGRMIQCQRHSWKFDFHSGACPEHPIYELRLFDVVEEGEWIYVKPQKEEIW